MKNLEEAASITYEQFQEWIYDNRLSGAPLEDIKELLMYLGYMFFHNLLQKYPEITLDSLDHLIFGGAELLPETVSRDGVTKTH